MEVFRANGITAELNERECDEPLPGNSNVTNAGFDGLDQSDEVESAEGSVLCSVYTRSFGRIVEVTKYPDDAETHLDVLNVGCSIYPSDVTNEQRQIQRLKRALEALVTATPSPG